MPKVSIVLVNYNHASYLDERITSILSQTYQDFELLIIDNGSTDESLKVIEKYQKDPRVKLQAYSTNALPYKRWNDSIALTKGEYLMLVCADDSCHPQQLEKLVEKLDQYPLANIAYSQSLEIDEESNQLRSAQYWTAELDENRWSVDFVDSGENECRYLYFKCSIRNIGAVLMRRSAFIEAGMFDALSDWMLYARILANTEQVVFLSEPLNYYRRDTTTLAFDHGDFLERRVQILHYLYQTITPPEGFLGKIYDPTLRWWFELAKSGKTSPAQNWKIFSLMYSIEPSIFYRVIKYLLKLSRRKFGQAANA